MCFVAYLIFSIQLLDANKFLIELNDSNFNATLYHYDLAFVQLTFPGK